MAEVHQFTHPRMVCASQKCAQTVITQGEERVKYESICHDNCYLKGVVQERLKHPKLQDCEMVDPMTGKYCAFVC